MSTDIVSNTGTTVPTCCDYLVAVEVGYVEPSGFFHSG